VEEENLNLKTVEELNIKLRTALFADLEAVYNPNEVSQYTIGVNTDNNKKRTVNDVNMPMVRGGLTAANLKLVIDPKASPDLKNAANFMQNQAIDSYTDKSEIYIPSGDNFRTLLVVQKL
jgi:hypothetical protein